MIHVRVLPNVPAHSLHSDDRLVPGIYAIGFYASAQLPVEDRLRAAMDVFHTNVPIKCLEHFDIDVTEVVPAGRAVSHDALNIASNGTFADAGEVLWHDEF